MKTVALLSALLLSGCASVTWVNNDPGRDFVADRNSCESRSGSELGVTHCMRSLGWDGE